MARVFFAILLSALIGCSSLSTPNSATDNPATDNPATDNKVAFDKLKALDGVWFSSGNNEHGKTEVRYRVTSGDNAVEEILFAGTPHEMLSVYYPSEKGLVVTHYCSLGNRPELKLVKSEGNKLVFELSPDSKIDVAREHHIHELTLTFLSSTQIRQEWVGFKNGTRNEMTTLELQKKRI